jgi:hypothetical protein
MYLLTYLLTPWSRVLLEKLTGFAASREIPHIYGTQKFITVLTSVRPPVPILSPLHPVPTTPSHFLKIHLNIILPSTSGSPHWSSCKVTTILVRFEWNLNFLDRFSKINHTPNFMKIHSVGAELFSRVRADRYDEANRRVSQFFHLA